MEAVDLFCISTAEISFFPTCYMLHAALDGDCAAGGWAVLGTLHDFEDLNIH